MDGYIEVINVFKKSVSFYLFIYLFIVVIICWDLNIVIIEYSPIVKRFTYLSVCCSWRRLIAMDTFLFSTDCTSKTAVAKTFPKHCLHI